jgi:hypothetical protein
MKIIDKTSAVLLKHDKVKDRALAYAAQDIETIIKTGGRTPKDKGSLRGRTRHERISSGKYRIIVPLVYASYQERGSRYDGSHVVKKYTTAGTGKGWFNAAIHTTAKNFNNLVKQASRLEGF